MNRKPEPRNIAVVGAGIAGLSAAWLLSQRNEAVLLDGAGQRFTVSDAQVRRDFGSAMAALPLLPEQFVIRFDLGRVEMTAESRETLQRLPVVFSATPGIQRYPSPWIAPRSKA